MSKKFMIRRLRNVHVLGPPLNVQFLFVKPSVRPPGNVLLHKILFFLHEATM